MGCQGSKGQRKYTSATDVQILLGVDALKKTYKISQKLGEGSYGCVYAAENISDPSIKVAIKVLDKRQMKPSDLTQLKCEIKIMQTIDHPNIVNYLETYDDGRYIYIVMETCEGGNLFDGRKKFTKNGEAFTEKEASQLVYKVLYALNHCHL